MTQRITSLNWLSTGDNSKPVAVQAIDLTLDPSCIVDLRGQFVDSVYAPRFITIDNIANNALIALQIGPIPYTVTQFAKFTYPIPPNTPSITISGNGVSIVAIFSIEKPDQTSDGANNFAIQKEIARQAASLNSSAMNPIINPEFVNWPDGTPIATTTGTPLYGPNGWQLARNGGAGNASMAQGGGLISSQFAAYIQRKAGDASLQTIFFGSQLLTVDSRQYAGQNPVTLSFDYLMGSDFSAASLQVTVYSGTGADQNVFAGFTGQAVAGTATFAKTNAATRGTVVCNIPANATQLAIMLQWTPTGVAAANDYFSVSRFQFDVGDAQAFRPVPLPMELDRGEYFYQNVNFGANWGFAGQAIASNEAHFAIQYRKPMRAAPAAIFTGSPDYVITSAAGGALAVSTLAAINVSAQFLHLRVIITTASLVAGNVAMLLANTLNSNIRLDARL